MINSEVIDLTQDDVDGSSDGTKGKLDFRSKPKQHRVDLENTTFRNGALIAHTGATNQFRLSQSTLNVGKHAEARQQCRVDKSYRSISLPHSHPRSDIIATPSRDATHAVSRTFVTNVADSNASISISFSPQCEACTAEQTACDSGRPCERCYELDIDECKYANDPSRSRPSRTMRDRDETSRRDFSRTIPKISKQMENVVENRESLNQIDTQREHQSGNHGKLRIEDSRMLSEDSLPVVPVEDRSVIKSPTIFDDVKTVLSVYKEIIGTVREDTLQAELARTRAQLCTAPGPVKIESSRNPFQRWNQKRSTQMRSVENKLVLKSEKVHPNIQEVGQVAEVLPAYRSIGRINQSFLTRNSHTRKPWPYFEEDEGDTELIDEEREEREKDIKQHYRIDVISRRPLQSNLMKQRICAEIAWAWLPHIDHLLRELTIEPAEIEHHISSTRLGKCSTCGNTPQAILASKAVLEDAELTLADDLTVRCRWLVEAFLQIASTSLIHVLDLRLEKCTPKALRVLPLPDGYKEDATGSQARVCCLCYTYNCTKHGFYVDEEILYNADHPKQAIINDPEHNHNIRVRSTIEHFSVKNHICSILCAENCKRANGSENPFLDRTIKDLCEPTFSSGRVTSSAPSFEACSTLCFLHDERRFSDGKIPFPDKIHPIVKHVATLPKHDARLACMVARFSGIPCVDVWRGIRSVLDSQVSAILDSPELMNQEVSINARVKPKHDFSGNNKDLIQWDPFIPCSHHGPCGQLDDGTFTCVCAEKKIHCESSCGCDRNCLRRFPGCRCHSGASRVCFNKQKCPCSQAARECDPSICGSCGVVEVLAPHNKYNRAIRVGRCSNNGAQLNHPARTIKAPSEVGGWGIYAGENLEENAFIGEYTGEIISKHESDRRNVISYFRKHEYRFQNSDKTDIDGESFGNKMRFINNSNKLENQNVKSRTMFANGEIKIVFHALRDIKRGEELFYDYGWPEGKTEMFREKGPVLAVHTASGSKKPRIRSRSPQFVDDPNVSESPVDETDHSHDDLPEIENNVIPQPAVRGNTRSERLKRKRIVYNSDDDVLVQANELMQQSATQVQNKEGPAVIAKQLASRRIHTADSHEDDQPTYQGQNAGIARSLRSRGDHTRLESPRDIRTTHSKNPISSSLEFLAAQDAIFDDDQDSSQAERMRLRSSLRNATKAKEIADSESGVEDENMLNGERSAKDIAHEDQDDGIMTSDENESDIILHTHPGLKLKLRRRSTKDAFTLAITGARTRRIHDNDKRRGGQTQRMAWQTRRERQKGKERSDHLL